MGTTGRRIAEHAFAGARVLVIAPHADDETYACGGTIAKTKTLGGEVFVICVSVGDLEMVGTTDPVVPGRRRADELDEAMAVLGVDGYEILFDDAERHMRLDALPQRDLIGLLEGGARYAIDRVRPDVLILPAPCSNQDHNAVFRAGFAACRPHLPGDKHFVPIILTADQPQLCWSPDTFKPNFYVDVSDVLDLKLKAHACHVSQLRPAPHHGSLENLERIARVRGAEIATEAAEAFACHRFIA